MNVVNMLNEICVSSLTVEESKAVYSLAERLAKFQLAGMTAFASPEDAKRYIRCAYMAKESEVFGCVFLDNQHRVLAIQELFHGTIDAAQVYPREVVKAALGHNAAACVFFHNHPSGTVEPSRADQAITKKLTDALALIDVCVIDHLVVGKGGVCSFAERGLLL